MSLVFGLCVALLPAAESASAKTRKKKPSDADAPVAAPAEAAHSAPVPAQTPAASWARTNLHLDAFGFWGFSKPGISESAPSPTLLHWGIGGTAAYRISDADLGGFATAVFAGLTSDFRFIGQYSALSTQIGNSRGTRWLLVAPVIGAVIDKVVVVKADFQFLGGYRLSNKSAEGGTFSYGSPFGGRLTGLYRLDFLTHSEHLFGGAQFEYLMFKSREISGVSTVNLDPALVLWQAGLTVAYVF